MTNTMLPRWLSGKESACWCRSCRRHGFDPWVRNIPWQPTPVWEFQGQRSLVDNSPQGDKRVRQGWACTHICTIYLYPFICQWILSCLPVQAPGAGTGNLLQCSCLENPIDRGVWRATVSPWGHKESDTTEQRILSLSFRIMPACIPVPLTS